VVLNFGTEFFLTSRHNVSDAELKRLLITGYMAAICIIAAVFYLFYDLANGVWYGAPAHCVLLIGGIFTMILLRAGYNKIPRILICLCVNLVIGWLTLLDPFKAGAFVFYIPIVLSAFIIFGSDKFNISIALTAFTGIIFSSVYLTDLRSSMVIEVSPEYIRQSFIVNILIASVISILEVYFLMHLNEEIESKLRHNQNETQLRNEELRKLNIELDRFVYSVGHDLRSPLSSILGLIQVASLTHDVDELKKIFELVKDRVNVQDNFIKEIMDYSRNARTETLSEEIHLNTIVHEVLESLSYLDKSFPVLRIVNISNDLIIVIDKVRLKILLSNLIQNAIKYADSTKPQPFVEIGFDEAAPSLYVKDNGIGIDAEHHSKIFEMFYRASEKSKGSGLGLFISSEVANKLNAKISVESAAGEGSTFQINFNDNLKIYRSVRQENNFSNSSVSSDIQSSTV
jgi:signal transduction histidine kinase